MSSWWPFSPILIGAGGTNAPAGARSVERHDLRGEIHDHDGLLEVVGPQPEQDPDHAVTEGRSDLGEVIFALTWAEGRTMKAEQVLTTEEQTIQSHQSQQNPHLSK